MNTKISFDEISKLGTEFYLSELKEKLEPNYNGDYVVIEVESKKYFLNNDLKIAIDEARAEFPNKLFCVIQVGGLDSSAMHYKRLKYAGNF